MGTQGFTSRVRIRVFAVCVPLTVVSMLVSLSMMNLRWGAKWPKSLSTSYNNLRLELVTVWDRIMSMVCPSELCLSITAWRTSSPCLTRSRTTSGLKPRNANSWTTLLINFLSFGVSPWLGSEENFRGLGTRLAVANRILPEVRRQREEELFIGLGEVHVCTAP